MIVLLILAGLLLANLFLALLNAGFLGHGSGWQKMHQCKHCKAIADHWSRVRPCTSCGEKTTEDESEITARLDWKGKWYNPFSWYNFTWTIKESSK